MKEGENIGRGLFLGFIAITCFALTLPATRVAVEYLDPTFVGLGRAAAAASLAVIILLFSRSNIPSLAEFKLLALVALGVVFGFSHSLIVGYAVSSRLTRRSDTRYVYR